MIDKHIDLYELVPGQSIGERDAEEVEGVGNGEGYPPPQPTRGSGERREFPQLGPGSPGRKRILVNFWL